MEANGLRVVRTRALVAALLFGLTQAVDAAEMIARAIGDPPEPPKRAPAPAKKPPEQIPAPVPPAAKPLPEPAPPDITVTTVPPEKAGMDTKTKVLIGGAIAVGLAALGGGGGGGSGGGSSASTSLRSP